MTAVRRRDALRLLATGASVAAVSTVSSSAGASADPAPREGAIGMLYDATRCIGCQACVTACSEANHLAPDRGESGGLYQMPADLNTRTKNIIKLYREPGVGESFVKRQCMHCLDPACVAGCPFEALHKDDRGVVSWTAEKCIGCRYCEVTCPFEVPKFEWERWNPKIVKCELCSDRLAEGKEPACTEVCPTHAVIFGTRKDLLADAHARLDKTPTAYAEKRVYGEHDAGGTQVLYLSGVPFAKLGLPTLARDTHPAHELRVQHVVYRWLAIPITTYAFLAARIQRVWKHHEEEVRKVEAEQGLKEQL